MFRSNNTDTTDLLSSELDLSDFLEGPDILAGLHIRGPGWCEEEKSVMIGAAQDAARNDAGQYDEFVLGVDQRLSYFTETDSEIDEYKSDIPRRCLEEKINIGVITSQFEATLSYALEEQRDAEVEKTKRANTVKEHEDELTGEGPFADPGRVDESRLKSACREVLPPATVGSAELELNNIVFKTLDLSHSTTVILSVVVSATSMAVAHLIGARAREKRGSGGLSGWAARWGMPVAAAVLLSAVQGFVAVLRSGYLDSPREDPTTHKKLPSTLTALGMPEWLMIVAWWALQAALTLYVAWMAERTHNPVISAHRKAQEQFEDAKPAVAYWSSIVARLTRTLAILNAHLLEISTLYIAEPERLDALGTQLKIAYGREMSHVKNDAGFTAVMDYRLAEEATRPRASSSL